MITPREELVSPTKPMPAKVVTTTEGDQVAVAGRSPLRPGDPVVKIAVPGRPSTTGKYAVGIPGLDQPSRLPARSSPGDPGMDREPGLSIGDGKGPLAMNLFGSHLPCDVGDHRTKPPELSRSLRKPRKGLEVNPELDRTRALPRTLCLSQQQLQQEIGPELVHAPALSLLLQPSRQPGQSPVGSLGPVGGKVMALEGGGAELVSRTSTIRFLTASPYRSLASSGSAR